MNELLNEFEKLKSNQKFGIGFLILLVIAFYPQIIILAFIVVIIYLVVRYLPDIQEEYNKYKETTPKTPPISAISRTPPAPNKINNFCSNCGTKIIENANFCPKCGHKI